MVRIILNFSNSDDHGLMNRTHLIAFVLVAACAAPSLMVADDATLLSRVQSLAASGDVASALELLRPLALTSDPPTQILVDAARLALAAREPTDALGWLEQASARPDAGEAPRLLGLLRLERGELLPAYLRLQPWVNAHPEDQAARLAAAMCAVQLDRLTEADDLLAPVPDEHPHARLLRGDIRVRRTESVSAIEWLEPLIGPQSPPALDHQARRLLARGYLGARRADDVVALTDGRTEDDPHLALLRAEAFYLLGKVDDALETLVPHAGDLPSIERERGRLLILVGRNDDAVEALRRVTVAQPEDREAWQHLSRALFADGQRTEAAAAAAQVKRLAQSDQLVSHQQTEEKWRRDNPTEQRLREVMAKREAGDLDGALAILREEMILQPQHPHVRAMASAVLHRKGRHTEALAEANMAIDLAPDLAGAYVHRSFARLALGQRSEAEADLYRAIEKAPGHPGATNQLAVMLAERSAFSEARQLLEDLLERDPDNAVALDNLERLPQQMGDDAGNGSL